MEVASSVRVDVDAAAAAAAPAAATRGTNAKRCSQLVRTPFKSAGCALAGTRRLLVAATSQDQSSSFCRKGDQGLRWRAGQSEAAALSSSGSSNSVPGAVEREKNARELVDALLSLVEGSDRGAMLAEQERGQVEEIIRILEQQCMPEPLQCPLLFGEWDVVYSSNPTATGGYYRSAIGRTLLKTKQMMQIVKEPDFISNKVSFAALGIMDGEVSLKGKLEALDNKWIKITFQSPDLRLGPIKFQYGGTSNVKIAIIYLDDRVRLGRGSRGSLFVFKRR